MAGVRLVRRLVSKHQRERTGLFVCEGEDLVEAALAAGLVPEAALVDAERAVEIPGAELVEPALIAELSTLPHPPRVIAVFRRADLPTGSERSFGLALWRVGDPGNVGTLLRAADAFEAFVALSPGCADPTAPKALREARREPLPGDRETRLIDDKEKAKRADYAFVNTGSLEELDRFVGSVVENLTS